jgi:hypothetical protein
MVVTNWRMMVPDSAPARRLLPIGHPGELGAVYRQLEREGIVENFDLFQQYLIVERNE